MIVIAQSISQRKTDTPICLMCVKHVQLVIIIGHTWDNLQSITITLITIRRIDNDNSYRSDQV